VPADFGAPTVTENFFAGVIAPGGAPFGARAVKRRVRQFFRLDDLRLSDITHARAKRADVFFRK
jgi:hypothetical protein